MNSVVNAFVTVFSILTDTKIFEIPILVWFILPALVTLALNFIKGKK